VTEEDVAKLLSSSESSTEIELAEEEISLLLDDYSQLLDDDDFKDTEGPSVSEPVVKDVLEEVLQEVIGEEVVGKEEEVDWVRTDADHLVYQVVLDLLRR
jgi:hypothetical protein